MPYLSKATLEKAQASKHETYTMANIHQGTWRWSRR